jgi:hypothetical protein
MPYQEEQEHLAKGEPWKRMPYQEEQEHLAKESREAVQ